MELLIMTDPLLPDGSWKYTNKLAESVSPYLLQHAHNPIDWYPWGQEAIQKAESENKPLFVSSGFSSCYWCHVMEREVFSNEEVAAFLNEHFICIKMDREERPDLDDAFMVARQIIARDGGWPNNVFLTPELKPFFAGGVFSIDGKYDTASFLDIVDMIREFWIERRQEVMMAAENIIEAMRFQLFNHVVMDKEFDATELLSKTMYEVVSVYDSQDGGFMRAPKFPHENYLLFLLDYFRLTQHAEAKKILCHSLDAMAGGGIHDQISGGFHRYSVDAYWFVPHFEKMLFNQALIADCYVEASILMKQNYYRYIAERTLDFTLEHLCSKSGYFYSSMDAELDGIEGAYYVLTEDEIISSLTKKELEQFHQLFSIADVPHLGGGPHVEGGVLHLKEEGIPSVKERNAIKKIAGKLLKFRQMRKSPRVDDKVVLSWNAMMVYTLAKAGTAFNRKDYLDAALKAMEFLFKKMVLAKSVRRIFRKSKAVQNGLLEDYAYLIRACLQLYEVTAKKLWLDRSVTLAKIALDTFWDEQRDAFMSSASEDAYIIPVKVASDDAIFADNAVMYHNLMKLTALTDDPHYAFCANKIVMLFMDEMQKNPLAYCHLLHGFMLYKHNLGDEHHSFGVAANDNRVSTEDFVAYRMEVPKVKVKEGAQFTFTIHVSVAEDWHVNADTANPELFIPAELNLASSSGIEVLDILYPASNRLTLDNEFEEVAVYDKSFAITAKCKVTDVKHIEISGCLTVQACNAYSCLLPTEIVVHHVVKH